LPQLASFTCVLLETRGSSYAECLENNDEIADAGTRIGSPEEPRLGPDY
jgi:hypothetical protein